MSRGKRCPVCFHDTIFTSPVGSEECSECGSSKRPCITGCGGKQLYFKGFGLDGKLLDDNEIAIDGTWQCLKCGDKEMKINYLMGEGDVVSPLQINREAQRQSSNEPTSPIPKGVVPKTLSHSATIGTTSTVEEEGANGAC